MEPQSQIGNYTLDERLGSGATADVFRAIQPGVERDVAIKVMHGHLSGSPDFSARFQREARSMGQLRHPHIARVIDFESTGDHPFMVIEYLAGGSLLDYLDAHPGGLPIDYSVAITRQLADALHYAHGMGMVHRDLKPANVMFGDTERRQAVLTDFGMARLADETMTATGTMLGTPAYMAPEQVRGEGALAPADQYSLGVMLFEMVTGQRPFHADSAHALMIRHTTEPVPSARTLNPDVSPELDALIRRSMAKMPADRFADAGEMKAALDALGGSAAAAIPASYAVSSGSAKPATIVVPAQAAGSAPQRWRLVAAAVGLLILAGATAFALTRGRTDDVVILAENQPATEVGAVDPETDTPQPLPQPTTQAAAPDSPSQPNPTAPPPAVTTLDPENLPHLFVTNANIIDGRLLVDFDRARQPTAGTSYVAWLDNTQGPIGEVMVDENGLARLDATAADARLARSFTISEEPAGSSPTVPTGVIVLSGTVDEAFRSETAEVLAHLDDAERELAIAMEHDGFMREAIGAGDLGQVRRHAEHIVNILDGADGTNFGDLDGSGLAENPGDNVGVRAYFETALALVESGSVNTAELTAATRSGVENVAASQPAFVRVLSADSIAEIETAAGTARLENIRTDLLRAQRAVQQSLALDLVTEGAARSLDAGAVWVTPAGSELVVRSGLGGAAAPDGVVNPTENVIVLLGEQPGSVAVGTLDEMQSLRVPTELEALRAVSTISLAIEVQGQAAAAPRVIAEARLSQATIDEILAVLDGEGSLLGRLEVQAQLAVDHVDLMQREIDAGNHAEVRRHAEHVVNLIEGEGGEHFGDLDGDGTVQNPGDDVGVFAYLNELEQLVGAAPDDSEEQLFYSTIWLRAIDGIRDSALRVVDPAVRVLATDSAAEAQPFATDAFAAGVLMLDGADTDLNGLVDLFAGELGVRGLARQAPTLISAPLLPVG